jgi:hypothetical protein
MYVPVVVALMFVLPGVSIVIEMVRDHGALILWVVGKWFVFWSVGVRLLLAGLRQIFQPRYTAETILGIKGAESLVVVRELGIANTAIGSVGVASIFNPAWVLPMAIVGGVFYGLAGVNHIAHHGRNRLQNIAMATDLYMAAVLLVFAGIALAR